MTATVTTDVTDLPESRVRVAVRVPAGEVERSVERKARELGGSLKLPGFRRGKVPAPLVIQRLGRETILEEAVRDGLGSWYVQALDSARIVPVGDPKVDLGELPGPGAELAFSFEIGVLPKATLGEYLGVEVGRAEPEVPDEEVEQEVDQLRDRLARLETAERPAEKGDFVVLDYIGSLVAEDGSQAPFEGGEGRDQMIELGSGRLIDGFEDGLLGAAAGEERVLELRFPADYPRDELAGRAASFDVKVKEVKHKELPAADDDLAIDTGFDDMKELRDDIRKRLLAAQEGRIEEDFRQNALDAAVANATVEVPAALVEGRAHEMWERVLHSLSHRGVSREAYIGISGRSEEESLAELAPEAERALRREAVLTAVVEAEGISPDEDELLASLEVTAEREATTPRKLLERLRDAGRLEELREDLAARRAIDLIAREAKPIPVEQARAREQLWTPEKERAERDSSAKGASSEGSEQAGGLWTPDR